MIYPMDRLGRWNGDGWDPVAPNSIGATKVTVLSHGWAPGLRYAVDEHDGLLRAWDPEAVTKKGKRFERWYAPLAEAITAHDPNALVLAYTWIDQSATTSSALRGVRSQRRSTVAGQALSRALQTAFGDSIPRLHLIGHSHGAKVVTVAASLLPGPPEHVTIFDSPENLMPVVGGALNLLSSYLRSLPVGRGPGLTFVDNYPSKYGVHYGREQGLGRVVDVMLQPDEYPLDIEINDHSYPWYWYLNTAQDISLGVGYAWSPLLADSTEPKASQLHQPENSEGDKDSRAPWVLIESDEEWKETEPAPVSYRQIEQIGELSTDGVKPFVARGFLRRKSGDHVFRVGIRWVEGPPDATVSFRIGGVEQWRHRRGWADEDERNVAIPVGGRRSGPGVFQMRLESSEPARLELLSGTVASADVAVGAEYRAWLRPALGSAVALIGLRSIGKRMRTGD